MAKNILITGASSGIGKQLAIDYAKRGDNLFLLGRNADRLNEVKSLCEQAGAKVEVAQISVTDKDAMTKLMTDWYKEHKFDVVIANAGISGGTSIHQIDKAEQFDDVVDINIRGVFNTVNPIIPLMIDNGNGQIVLLSSMAGFVGLPTAPAYSVSKCTVKAYGDAIRPLLKKCGIKVSIVFPGFIKTPLTKVNNFEMPFLLEVEEASKIMMQAIDKQKAYIAFPWQMYFITRAMSLLPWFVRDFILSFAPRK